MKSSSGTGQMSYICAGDDKQQSNNDISSNLLILDTKRLGVLQGADRDGKRQNEVQKAQSWKGIVDDSNGIPNL